MCWACKPPCSASISAPTTGPSPCCFRAWPPWPRTPGRRARTRAGTSFVDRLPATLGRLSDLGLAYDPVPFEPQASFGAPADTIATQLDTGLQVGQVRYTTDGSEPVPTSRRYQAPLALKPGVQLRARTFLDQYPLGRTHGWTVTPETALTRRSHQLSRCTEGLILNLEDDGANAKGERGDLHARHPQSLLDLEGRRPDQRRQADRDGRPAAVQLPARQQAGPAAGAAAVAAGGRAGGAVRAARGRAWPPSR
jgi:hypothetical protein